MSSLAYQLDKLNLSELYRKGGLSVVYQHLGVLYRSGGRCVAATLAAMKERPEVYLAPWYKLAQEVREGRLWLAGLGRMLHYVEMLRDVAIETDGGCAVRLSTGAKVSDPEDHFQGLTLYVNPTDKPSVSYGGRQLRVVHNGPDETGALFNFNTTKENCRHMALTDGDLERIHKAGWNFPPELWATLGDYEKNFAVLELDGIKTPGYYQDRLAALDFKRRGRVLDAACGMGQWANALASLGNEVVGVDLMQSRIDVARALTAAQGNACQFQTGSIEKLPFETASFDGVFCYGAFMFTAMPVTLGEFARVLKPGGRLYLNGNTWGWYAHLILDRGLRGGGLLPNQGCTAYDCAYLRRTVIANRHHRGMVAQAAAWHWIYRAGAWRGRDGCPGKKRKPACGTNLSANVLWSPVHH